MKQLSLFEQTEPQRPQPKLPPMPTAKQTGDYLEVLGVRYSITPSKAGQP